MIDLNDGRTTHSPFTIDQHLSQQHNICDPSIHDPIDTADAGTSQHTNPSTVRSPDLIDAIQTYRSVALNGPVVARGYLLFGLSQ